MHPHKAFSIGRRWAAAAVFCAILGVPANAGVAYVSSTVSNMNLVVTAVTDSYYAMAAQHTAYATAWARSPSGRTAQNTYYQRNRVTVTTLLPIAPEDGTFETGNINPREWCPFGMIMFYLVQATQQTQVPAWVQLVRAWTTNANLAKVNGERDFYSEVKTSPNCAGLVTLWVGLGKTPNELKAKILYPQEAGGDGIEHENGMYVERTIPGGNAYSFKMLVRTPTTNTHTGQVSVSANVEKHPTSCQVVMGPDGTFTKTVVYTVN